MMATSSPVGARDTIGKLIEVCRDGQCGFELAARGVGDPILRAELLQYGGQRQEFVAELHEAIRTIGPDADDAGPLAGTLHRGWVELKQAIATGDRAAILAECEHAELEAADAYRTAMASGLPPTLAGVVNTQFQAIARVLNRLHSLRDAARV